MTVDRRLNPLSTINEACVLGKICFFRPYHSNMWDRASNRPPQAAISLQGVCQCIISTKQTLFNVEGTWIINSTVFQTLVYQGALDDTVTDLATCVALYFCNAILGLCCWYPGIVSVSFFSTLLTVVKGRVGMSWYGPRARFILFPYHLAYDPSLVLLWFLSEEMSCVLPTEDGSLMNVK